MNHLRKTLALLGTGTAVALGLQASPAQAVTSQTYTIHLACNVSGTREGAVDLQMVRWLNLIGGGNSFQVMKWRYNTAAHFYADRVDVQYGFGGEASNPGTTWVAAGGSTSTHNDVPVSFGWTTVHTAYVTSNSTHITLQLRVWDDNSDPGTCTQVRVEP